MLNDRQRERLSRLIAYLLRHEQNIKRSRDGFVGIPELLAAVKERIRWVEKEHLDEVLEQDRKKRYEVKGDSIRARYGHSVEVELDLPEADVGLLYHGTSQEMAEKILTEGLNPMGRQKVHLSITAEDALEVGRRRSLNPVVLVVDARAAKAQGASIKKASDKIFLADSIPRECLKLLE